MRRGAGEGGGRARVSEFFSQRIQILKKNLFFYFGGEGAGGGRGVDGWTYEHAKPICPLRSQCTSYVPDKLIL